MKRKPKLSQKENEIARQRLYKKYGRICWICKRHEDHFKRRLCVDHRHSDGKIRGLLCFYDNRYLVGRHTLESAKKVYEYLLRTEKE